MVFIAALAVIAAILYLAGFAAGKQGVDVGGCRGEWSTVPRTLVSDLCPNATEPCTAQPFTQQHNAIVDALLCACGTASDGGTYPNSGLNGQIERTFTEASGTQLSVREICEGGGGGFMVRWRYG
jgi:hypothetical protein